ncbi:MAG: PepSY domain-containing protein, partial [Proteobacteria bacterium]
MARVESPSVKTADTALYRTVWRWHFYAGLLVIPLVLILSVTGAAYLFKPQMDRWEERDFRGLAGEGAVSPAVQLQAALAAWPGARFDAYRLPENPGDAAAISLAPADGSVAREVFVSPQGEVLGSREAGTRISATIAKIHSSLLLGKVGNWTVEMAASWAIVMILTGLYLWWPRGGGLAGILWPRWRLRGRPFWRDVHAVTGFWVSGLALVMLVSGLPWSSVWGSGFAKVRAELGLVQGVQDWKTGAGGDDHSGHGDHGEHGGHGGHAAMPVNSGSDAAAIPAPVFELYVERARAEGLAFPASVLPPGAPQRFGPPTSADVWTIKSEAQNRPLGRTITYDAASGR